MLFKIDEKAPTALKLQQASIYTNSLFSLNTFQSWLQSFHLSFIPQCPSCCFLPFYPRKLDIWGVDNGTDFIQPGGETETSPLYSHLKGSCSKKGIGLFSRVTSNKVRQNGLKFHQERFKLVSVRIYSQKGCLGIEMDCPEMWWSHHPCRYLRDKWTWGLRT